VNIFERLRPYGFALRFQIRDLPPTIPFIVPADVATSVSIFTRSSVLTGVAPSVSNANVSSASPASIAIASPNCL